MGREEWRCNWFFSRNRYTHIVARNARSRVSCPNISFIFWPERAAAVSFLVLLGVQVIDDQTLSMQEMAAVMPLLLKQDFFVE